MDEPRTLLEAVSRFSEPQAAHDYFVSLRWPNGIACPRMGCGSADVARIKNRNVWRCRDCNRQFTAKVNSVFEDSPIGFNKWLPAMWMLSNCRNGVSSCEIARALGVTQKTAWFMLHRLREAMRCKSFVKLSGEVEADETFIGGKLRNKRLFAGRQGSKRHLTTVFGVRQRKGDVRAMVVPDTKQLTLHMRLRDNVEAGTTLYTDAWKGYSSEHLRYAHRIIDHSKEYVRGQIHTNGIECFWSVLKRTIKGTYICPRPKHLDRYLDEQVFRFNSREEKDGYRFRIALKGADSKRLTWKALVA